jgi:glutathione S-transferase
MMKRGAKSEAARKTGVGPRAASFLCTLALLCSGFSHVQAQQNNPSGKIAIPLVIIHHVEVTRAERIIWLMEELGLPYKLDFIPSNSRENMLALRRAHPLGMAPTVEVGDRTMVESAFIIEYLVEHFGGNRLVPPKSSPEYWNYRFFMHFAEGTSATPTVQAWFDSSKLSTERYQQEFAMSSEETLKRLNSVLAFLDDHLKGRSYLAGETFTGADIMMYLPLRSARNALEMNAHRVSGTDERIGFVGYPYLDAYYHRIINRPGFKRANAKANPNGSAKGWVP